MYRLKTEHCFDAAHFLANYQGKCHNIHGHHWRVVLEVEGSELQQDVQHNGMLVDFSDLKHDLRAVVDSFDHTLIVERGTLSQPLLDLLRQDDFSVTEIDIRPTAENFAKLFYDRLTELGYTVCSCAVYETPTNYASYTAENGEKS